MADVSEIGRILIQEFLRIELIQNEECLTYKDSYGYSDTDAEIIVGRFYQWNYYPEPVIRVLLSRIVNIIDSTALVREITGKYFGVLSDNWELLQTSTTFCFCRSSKEKEFI